MMRLLTLVAASAAFAHAAACGGAARTTSSSSTTPPVLAKKLVVSWGIEPRSQDGDAMADLFLATTDETGKQVSFSLGRYKGACKVITPGPEMNALSGVACRTGGTGTELHAVNQNGESIIVLKLGIDEGAPRDPMAREEVTRMKVELGTKVEAAP